MGRQDFKKCRERQRCDEVLQATEVDHYKDLGARDKQRRTVEKENRKSFKNDFEVICILVLDLKENIIFKEGVKPVLKNDVVYITDIDKELT